MSTLTRILGDSPLRVALKLLVASFLVGLVLSTLGWSPMEILARFVDLLRALWSMGIDAVYRFGDYILLGGVIVIPAFIVMRLLAARR